MHRSAALAALLLAAPATAEEPMEVLPSGHAVATVRVGDKGPRRFIIDTGASNTNLLARFVAASPELERKAAARPLEAASGSLPAVVARIPRLTTQGRTFLDLPAFLLPAGPVDALGVDGVLGADVISAYAMELDVPGRRWSLTEAPAPAALRGMLPPVAFTLDTARAPRLTVMLNGKPVPALLDTGANLSVINWAAAELAGVARGGPALRGGGQAKGASAHAAAVQQADCAMAVGDHRRDAAPLRIADLPIFKAVGMEGPAMILGLDAFADRRIVIDHPRGRLHIAVR